MIKNIIFDIGNVLTDFRWREFLEDKGFDDAKIKEIEKATVMSPYWNEFDRGALSYDEVMKLFEKENPDIRDDLYKAFGDIHGMVTKRDYAIPWIESLKKAGYKVYYLSNFSEKAFYECADSLDFLPYCDGGILSYRELLIKPDEKIYDLLCKRYSLDPSECVFIDDTPRNIEAGEKYGINGIVFKTYDQVNNDLKGMGVSY